jgi:cobalt-zinc-cadmium resistance protein CzcA
MVSKLIQWAINSPVVVMLMVVALTAVGSYAFVKVNVEAYPDPAPAIIEVVAQWPGASAEEVERQVTIPIEVALAGMPGLKYTRAKSMFGLAHLRNQFEYGIDYERAKQEVINRLANVEELPKVVKPTISPASPIGEILRYTLSNPKDALGRPIYTLNDLKALNDWTLVREFKRVPRVAGVVSSGGTVKRYEIQPDPDRLKEYDITLEQLQEAIAESNENVGGDYIIQGPSIQVVRGIGLIGGGEDPMVKAMTMKSAQEAADYLRAEERRRIDEIRHIVIASTNNVPVRVEHVVDGGPIHSDEELGQRGVLVSYQTRQGQLGITRFRQVKHGEHEEEELDAQGHRIAYDQDDNVQGIILLYKGQQSIPALTDVGAKIDELNNSPGRLLPGVQIEPFYNRSSLIAVTTHTVHENLLVGIGLVTLILVTFLGNMRAALIVAINIPLALMFAFAVLFLRGKSANLLSIGAVDFGIIVDSSVIMVENIFHRLSSGEGASLSLHERIIRASREVEKSLFYSTVIMICAMLPLFTMTGPEGQIFGPMADTYAFALGGALLLALTVSPVLCMFFLKNLKHSHDNFLVRWLKSAVMWQLEFVLRHRVASVAVFAALAVGTAVALPFMGREFMPELEEGNMVVRGTFPVNVSLQEASEKARIARHIMTQFGEVRLAASQVGRPDDGTDPIGYYNAECFVPLKAPDDWPVIQSLGRRRSKSELIRDMNHELSRNLIGINWDFSQMIRDNVLEALSGVKGENSVKIIGTDLQELERLASETVASLSKVDGVFDPGVFHIRGQSNLAFPIDREKCALWGVRVTDVNGVIRSAVGGNTFTEVIEGEKRFDVALRWPAELRENVEEILNIPVDVARNSVTSGSVSTEPGSPLTGASTGLSSVGTSLSMPSTTGNIFNATTNNLTRTPRRRLGDLVTPLDAQGNPSANGDFVRPGASTIAREQGNRLIAVKFSVRGRDLASTVEDAQKTTAPIFKGTAYRTIWSGEFQQMQEAEKRLLIVVMLSMVLILIMLYLAFKSLLDAAVIYANVSVMCMGGIWTLFLTGTNFNISAAVGFISILGVAVMNGLLMVSSFNHARAHAVPLYDALRQGVDKLARPITMTALAAILGMLPAAFSTKVGSQSQRPLAIVVVGGMITTLIMFNLVPLLYSFYGNREPPQDSGND